MSIWKKEDIVFEAERAANVSAEGVNIGGFTSGKFNIVYAERSETSGLMFKSWNKVARKDHSVSLNVYKSQVEVSCWRKWSQNLSVE